MIRAFTVFHLNLGYSSIAEEQRAEVVRQCYWPLLCLAEQRGLAFGIEASGYTLEVAAALDPSWLAKLRYLVTSGPCEFVGSGYAQIIGPLVPAEVNAANLRLGNRVYESLLGVRPAVALVNEQAYSAGLIQHYLDAGYRAIVMEWDNPSRHHPEWDSEWRYFPQLAVGQLGEEIPVIWNKAIAFQKFQRYAHGESELDEYLAYLHGHDAEVVRSFPIYGNDVEIFDFRPGRYHTEAPLAEESEWRRIERLFEAVQADPHFSVVRPSQVLESLGAPAGGHPIHLESAVEPVPVKKQRKYNVTRWAVTGRDDLGINTACWRAFAALRSRPDVTDDDWRELCGLWASDYRTHITTARWEPYRERLASLERALAAGAAGTAADGSRGPHESWAPVEAGSDSRISREGRYLSLETEQLKLRLNCGRGMAIDGLWFKAEGKEPLCGTSHHGFYDDITWGADFYSGHLVFESPGRPKVTDLSPVEPRVRADGPDGDIVVEADVATDLGVVRKTIRLRAGAARVDLDFQLEWPEIPVGSLRLGDVTLNPAAFDARSLFYRCHNGGRLPETFALRDAKVEHGAAVSFLVSASHALGVTEGVVELGDAQRVLRVEVDKTVSALVGLINYQPIRDTYFCRLTFSAAEVDETRRGPVARHQDPLRCHFTLSAESQKGDIG